MYSDFDELMTDVVSVYDETGKLVKDGVKASVQRGKSVHTNDVSFAVDIGYFVDRKTRNGITERYKVLEPNYFDGMDGIPAHYQMKVVNVKAIPDPRNSSTVNTIHASGNARIYQNSTDNSVNNYSSNDFKQALGRVKTDILDLDLEDVDRALTLKAITKITEEVDTGNPNKDKITAYISLLPTAVAALDSVVKLAAMVGLG